MQQDVIYEWKPVVCGKCKEYGHETDHCKKRAHQECRAKATTIPPPEQELNKETKGNGEEEWIIIPPQGTRVHITTETAHIPTCNAFDVLDRNIGGKQRENGAAVNDGNLGSVAYYDAGLYG